MKINQEQEMRETSYFKNQTDDDRGTFVIDQTDQLKLQLQPQSLALKKGTHEKQLISINDQINFNQITNKLPSLKESISRQVQNIQGSSNQSDLSQKQQILSNKSKKDQFQNDQNLLLFENEQMNLLKKEEIALDQLNQTDLNNLTDMNQENSQIQQKISRGSTNKGSILKDGIKMFKIQSKSQLRWNRQNKNKFNEKKELNCEIDEQNIVFPLSPMSNDDGQHHLNVQTHAFNDLIDQFPNDYNHNQEINSANIFKNKSPLSINKNPNKTNEIINETDIKRQKDVSYTQNEDSNSPKKKLKGQQKKQNNKKNLFESDKLPQIIKSNQDCDLKVDENIKFQNQEVESVKQMFTSMSDIGFPQNIHNYNLNLNKQSSKKDLGQKGMQNELITIEQIQKLMNTQNNWRVRTMTIDQILHDIQQKVEDDPEYLLHNSEKYLDFFVHMLSDQNFKIVLNTLNVINIIVGMKVQKNRYQTMLKYELEGQNKVQSFQWGLSNQCLSKHIPQIVKKLSDSKNIIRQEASKSLFFMNDIMRNGNKKENNFIALILPYLNNSSNWHIREELINLLIRCFLTSQDRNEFSPIQVLDSLLQLLIKDSNEKIRSLALESIVSFSSVFYKSNEKNIAELLCQITDNKEIFDIINQRIESGMFPSLNEQQLEFPYFEHQQIQNYDVDSVAQSMTNQTSASQGGYSYINQQNINANQLQHQLDIYNRRKQSIGAVSTNNGQNFVNQNQINEALQNKTNVQRGNSSGRKIVVATANAPKLQNGLSQLDDMQNHNFQSNKRTSSANNPNFEFENNNSSFIKPKHNPSNSFNMSAGIVILEQDQNFKQKQNMIEYTNQANHEQQQILQNQYIDEILSNGKNNFSIITQIQDFNASNFLPSLQKNANHSNIDQKSKPFSQFSNHSDHRNIGSSGGLGLQGHFKSNDIDQFQHNKFDHGGMKLNNNRQGLQLLTQIAGDNNLPNSKTSKRNLKISNHQHGTPGQPLFKHQDQLSKGVNLAQNHFNRGNSGKIMGNHQINSNQSDQSPSILFENRFQVGNQIILGDFSQNTEQILNYSGNMQGKLLGGINEGLINPQGQSFILGGSLIRQNIEQINENNHSKQNSVLSGSVGNNQNINTANFNVQLQKNGQDYAQNKIQQKLTSENGYNIENSDVFSIVGMQSHQSTYNYNNTNTPSNYNNLNQHDQILYSASSGYRQQAPGNLLVRMNDSGAQNRVQNNLEKQNLPIQAQGPREFGFEVDDVVGNNSFNFVNMEPHEKFTPDHSLVMQGNDLFGSGVGHQNNKNKFDLKSQLIFSEQQNSLNNQPAYLNILKDEYQKRNYEQNQVLLNNIYSISGQGSASGQERNQILSSGESNNRVSGIVKKFQNGQSTFYSNGTNMTGITGATATTGESGNPLQLQNLQANGINELLKQQQIFNQDTTSIISQNLKSTDQTNDQLNQNGILSQNQNNQIQSNLPTNQIQIVGRQGPIKATRFLNNQSEKTQQNTLYGQNQINGIGINYNSRQQQLDQQNDLVIDTRRVKVGKQNLLKSSLNSNGNIGNISVGTINNNKNLRQQNQKLIGSQTMDTDPLIQIVASSSTENIDQNIGFQTQTTRKTEGTHLINSDLNFIEQSINNDNLNNLNEEQDPLQTFQIVYTPVEDLESLEKPERDFKKCLSKGQGIYSNDWIKQFEGCQIIRQVCKHHQSLIIQTANQLQNLVSTLIKLVDSLRSAVSRISLMTLNEMFIGLKRVMEPCLDPIMKILLKKSSDTNNFIAEVTDQCFLSLVQNCQEQKVLQILQLQNMNSRSNLYRLKICQCLQNIVKSLGNNILFFNQNDKLLVQLANYLHDQNQDVRQAAKTAFVCMSQQIMGQNELEKLLQRVLNEVQYKKVKEYLDKEPSHVGGNQSSQIDFVITNANNNNQNVNCQPIAKKIIPSSKIHKQSQKIIKQLSIKIQQQQNINTQNNLIDKNGLLVASQNNTQNTIQESQNQDNLVLNIQSRQLINPQLQLKQDQNINYQKSQLQQNKNGNNTQSQQQIQSLSNNGNGNQSQRGLAIGNGFYQSGIANGQKNGNLNNEINQNNQIYDAFFQESLKDFILKTQINDWRSRLEASELLFDFIKNNNDKILQNIKMLELSEAISKLLNDANAKIQINSLENFQKLLQQIFQYIKNHLLPFYKALLTNLGSSNVGVRKISDQIIKQVNENLQQERLQYLLPPLIQIIQNNNNIKLKVALFDQLLELLQDYQQQTQSQSPSQITEQQNKNNQNILMNQPTITSLIQNQIPQLTFKLLEDSKSELKVRCEKLLKKLCQILGQQQLFDKCPQNKLQKVCDICLSNGLISSTGQQTSALPTNNKNTNSQNFSTGTFGANGSSLILNSRV